MIQERLTTAELLEESCKELFASDPIDSTKVKKSISSYPSSTSLSTPRTKKGSKLTPLNTKVNNKKKKDIDSNINSSYSLDQDSETIYFSPSRKKSISLILQDHHYISTLQHKAAGISGLTPLQRNKLNAMLKDKKESDSEVEDEEEEDPEDSFDLDDDEEIEDDEDIDDEDEEDIKISSDSHSSNLPATSNDSSFSIEFMQLQSIQNSQELVNLIKLLIKNFTDFSTILKNNSNINSINNKKILSNINDNYVILYEDLLCILMNLYRKKIKKIITKNNIKYRKKIKQLNIKLENLPLKTEYNNINSKNLNLHNENLDLLNENKDLRTHKTELQFQNEKLQFDLNSSYNRIKLLEKALQDEKNKNIDLNLEKYNKINEKNLLMKEKNLEKNLKIDLSEEENPEKQFIDLKSKSKFKYPLVTSSTQTEINDESCLWDIQNGWSLPINLTSNIRRLWRDSINFASCKFCRGVGAFALKTYLEVKRMANSQPNSINFNLISDSVVINHENYIGYLLRGGFYNTKKYKKKVLLRQNLQKQLELLKQNQTILPEIHNDIDGTSGTFPRTNITESSNNFSEYSYNNVSNDLKQSIASTNSIRISDFRVTSSSHSLWTYPPELVNFLSNLPQSIQALNPLSKKWVVENCYLLFHYKLLIEYEDSFLESENHKVKSISKFGTAENSNNLLDFIIEIYLRSYESRSDAEIRLYIFIKSLKEYYISNPLLVLFTKSLQMMHRHKVIKEKKNDKKTTKNTISNISAPSIEPFHTKETIFSIYEDSISKEMLSIILFVRQLLLFPKYNGVYKISIEQAHTSKQQLHIFNQFQQDLYVISKKLFSFFNIRKIPINNYSDSKGNSEFQFEIQDKYKNQLLCPHLILDMKHNLQHFYLPLDRCIRILKPFLIGLSYDERFSIYRLIETKTRVLNPDGTISIPEGMLLFIRSTMRLFIYSNNFNAIDIASWEIIRDTYSHNNHHQQEEYHGEYRGEDYSQINEREGLSTAYKNFKNQAKLNPEELDYFDKANEEEESINKKNFERNDDDDLSGNEDLQEDIFKMKNKEKDSTTSNASHSTVFNTEAGSHVRLSENVYKITLVTNMDIILLIISEILSKKSLEIEKNLVKIFEEGDVNSDNVLSFYEFQSIIHKIVPNYSTRKIMSMFRQALLSNTNENSNCINANQFINICKDYSLFQLWDLNELKYNYYKDILPDFMRKNLYSSENTITRTSYSFDSIPTKNQLPPKTNKKSFSNETNPDINSSSPLNSSRDLVPFSSENHISTSIPTLPSVYSNESTPKQLHKTLLKKSFGSNNSTIISAINETINSTLLDNSSNSANTGSPISGRSSKKVSFNLNNEGLELNSPPVTSRSINENLNIINPSSPRTPRTSTITNSSATNVTSKSSFINKDLDTYRPLLGSESMSTLLKGSFKMENSKDIRDNQTLTSSSSTGSIPSNLSIPQSNSSITPISTFTPGSTRSIFSNKTKNSKKVDTNSIAASVKNVVNSLKNSSRNSFELIQSLDEEEFGFKNYESIKVEDPEDKRKREELERKEKERIEKEEKERLENEEIDRLEREAYLKREFDREEKRRILNEKMEEEEKERERLENEEKNKLQLSLETKILSDFENDLTPHDNDLIQPLTSNKSVPTLESLLRTAELNFENQEKKNRNSNKKTKEDIHLDPFSINGKTIINSNQNEISSRNQSHHHKINIQNHIGDDKTYILDDKNCENNTKEIFNQEINGVNIYPNNELEESSIFSNIDAPQISLSLTNPSNKTETSAPEHIYEISHSARSHSSSSKVSQKLLNNLATSNYYDEIDSSRHLKPDSGIARIKIDETLSKKSSKKILEELRLRKLRRDKEKIKQYEEKNNDDKKNEENYEEN